MQQSPPIAVTHLFDPLDRKLIELLSSLTDEQWHYPTIAKLWTVKDIAAHLLDGNIRVLSMLRDNYFGLTPGHEDLIDFLNNINADWVKAMKRMSPRVLLWLLEITGKPVTEQYATLDPYARAIFPVAWAGETESLNWMHLAREYTEKFIHQQQIREAVDQPGIMTKEFFYPFISTFMMALPYTYRNTDAKEGTVVKVSITTEVGGDWYMRRENDRWVFTAPSGADAILSLDPRTAWKLFSKGIGAADAKPLVNSQGDSFLAEVALNMISVMA